MLNTEKVGIGVGVAVALLLTFLLIFGVCYFACKDKYWCKHCFYYLNLVINIFFKH